MASANDNQIPEDNDEASAARAGELNENKQQSRNNKEAKDKKEKEEEGDKKPSAVDTFSATTSGLLKGAWKNLVMSWGLTLIYIDIHVFSAMVMGNKLFCKLGMEWVPSALKEARFEEAKKLGKKVGAIEGPGLACLNLGCLMMVIVFMMIVAMILDVIKNPLSHLTELTGWVWNVGLGTVVKWLGGG